MTNLIEKAARVTDRAEDHIRFIRAIASDSRRINEFGVYKERARVVADLEAMKIEIQAALWAIVGATEWPGPADYTEIAP